MMIAAEIKDLLHIHTPHTDTHMHALYFPLSYALQVAIKPSL